MKPITVLPPVHKVLFPNEHGAWAMLFTAFLLGWLAAPELSWKPLYILPAALGAFLTRYPVGLYFKKRRVTRALKIPLTREKFWFQVYAAFTVLVGFPLFYPLGWWWLLIFLDIAALCLFLHLKAITQKRERTLFVELTAMAGISCLVPATATAAILRMDWEPLFLWLAFLLFFGWRFIVVRKKIRERHAVPIDLRQVGKGELNYSLFFLILLVTLVRVLYTLRA
ncbi:MAG: YwiC-like family protein [bacterium]|nr:YwiC-like family protein [bacterium]